MSRNLHRDQKLRRQQQKFSALKQASLQIAGSIHGSRNLSI